MSAQFWVLTQERIQLACSGAEPCLSSDVIPAVCVETTRCEHASTQELRLGPLSGTQPFGRFSPSRRLVVHVDHLGLEELWADQLLSADSSAEARLHLPVYSVLL
jgi:hypothetical protein